MNDNDEVPNLLAKIVEAQDKVNRAKISSGSYPNVKVDSRTGTWDHSYDWQRELYYTPNAEKLEREKKGLLMEIDRLRRDASIARAELAAINAQWSKEAKDEFKKAATPDVARIVNDHDFLTSEVERLSADVASKVQGPPEGMERHYCGNGLWELCIVVEGEHNKIGKIYEEWTFNTPRTHNSEAHARFSVWMSSILPEGESWEHRL